MGLPAETRKVTPTMFAVNHLFYARTPSTNSHTPTIAPDPCSVHNTHMNELLQQQAQTIQAVQGFMILYLVLFALILLGTAYVVYIMFDKVLIPIASALSNYLNAAAWNIDHKQGSQARPIQDSESPFKPRA